MIHGRWRPRRVGGVLPPSVSPVLTWASPARNFAIAETGTMVLVTNEGNWAD